METYTWQALPPARPRTRAQLADGIAAELDLARDRADRLGLRSCHDRQEPRPTRHRCVVLDVVGLTPAAPATTCPQLRALGDARLPGPARHRAARRHLRRPVHLPHRRPPAEHGIVGNGWYFRDLGEVLLWRQHNALVGGEKIWDAARRADPGYTVANICWWYAMGADTDWTVTPRPVYYADGRKEPDCYTRPPALHDELTDRARHVPPVHLLGPGRGHALLPVDPRRHPPGLRRAPTPT